MEIFTQTYSKTIIIAAIIGGVHYGRSRGLIGTLNEGAQITAKELDAEQVKSSETAILDKKSEPLPVVVTNGTFETGKTYDLCNEFCTDSGSRFASVRVLDVLKIRSDGTEIPVSEYVLKDDGRVYFPNSYTAVVNANGKTESGRGMYQIRMSVVDLNGKQQTSTVCVGVKKGGQG